MEEKGDVWLRNKPFGMANERDSRQQAIYTNCQDLQSILCNSVNRVYCVKPLRLGRRGLVSPAFAIENRRRQPRRHRLVIRGSQSHHSITRRQCVVQSSPNQDAQCRSAGDNPSSPTSSDDRSSFLRAVRRTQNHDSRNTFLHKEVVIGTIERLLFRHRIRNHFQTTRRGHFIQQTAK